MKKNLFLSLSLMAASFLFIACDQSRAPISDLQDLVTELDGDDLTSEDLEKITDEYAVVLEELGKYEYSEEDWDEIAKLQGKYAAKLTKAAMKNANDMMENVGKRFESGMKSFQKEMEKE